jgi:mannitol/fructose-specific phosphotransferase system IIA component (Ntr-type)
MNLRELVDPRLVFTDIGAGSRDGVLRSLAERLEREGAIPSAEDLLTKLLERERQGSTAIGKGVAIPHCKLARLDRVVVAVGVAASGVAVETPDQEPVRLFFLVISPESSPAAHLQSLAAISKWLKGDGNLARIRAASTPDQVRACLAGESLGGASG